MVVIRLGHRARRQPDASFLPPHGVRQQPDVVRRSPSDSFLSPNAVRRQPDVVRRSTSDSFRAVWGARSAYNEAMRKRRWWFAGLALALLAACLGVWKWSERPPFPFLNGAKLWFVQSKSPSPSVDMFYISEKSIDELALAASAEVASENLDLRGAKQRFFSSEPGYGFAIYDLPSWKQWSSYNFAKQNQLPELPDGGTMVAIHMRPTWVGRVRAWLFSLRWKGTL